MNVPVATCQDESAGHETLLGKLDVLKEHNGLES